MHLQRDNQACESFQKTGESMSRISLVTLYPFDDNLKEGRNRVWTKKRAETHLLSLPAYQLNRTRKTMGEL